MTCFQFFSVSMQAVLSAFCFKSAWSFVKVMQTLKRRETDFVLTLDLVNLCHQRPFTYTNEK